MLKLINPWYAHKMTIQPDPQSVTTFILNIAILRKREKNYSSALNQLFVIIKLHYKVTFKKRLQSRRKGNRLEICSVLSVKTLNYRFDAL